MLDLVVLLIGIDLVEVMVLAEDVLRGQQARLDRMIGVVVPEGPVSPDDLDVLEAVDELLDLLEVLLVANDVRRVRPRSADRRIRRSPHPA